MNPRFIIMDYSIDKMFTTTMTGTHTFTELLIAQKDDQLTYKGEFGNKNDWKFNKGFFRSK